MEEEDEEEEDEDEDEDKDGEDEEEGRIKIEKKFSNKENVTPLKSSDLVRRITYPSYDYFVHFITSNTLRMAQSHLIQIKTIRNDTNFLGRVISLKILLHPLSIYFITLMSNTR